MISAFNGFSVNMNEFRPSTEVHFQINATDSTLPMNFVRPPSNSEVHATFEYWPVPGFFRSLFRTSLNILHMFRPRSGQVFSICDRTVPSETNSRKQTTEQNYVGRKQILKTTSYSRVLEKLTQLVEKFSLLPWKRDSFLYIRPSNFDVSC
jgi:hypothetical protein